MPNTQRNRRRIARKPGRPKVPQQPEQDGARLRGALATLKWTQAEVAARTGISQKNLTGVLGGKRNISREELRALAKIGIPADYILGAEKKLILLGETRPVADLGRDLASRVTTEVVNPADVPEPWLRGSLELMIEEADMIGALVLLMREERDAAVEWLRMHQMMLLAITSLPKEGADVALVELQRGVRNLTPYSGRVFRWPPRGAQRMHEQTLQELGLTVGAAREDKGAVQGSGDKPALSPRRKK